jgi:hypothetical protein
MVDVKQRLRQGTVIACSALVISASIGGCGFLSSGLTDVNGGIARMCEQTKLAQQSFAADKKSDALYAASKATAFAVDASSEAVAQQDDRVAKLKITVDDLRSLGKAINDKDTKSVTAITQSTLDTWCPA